MVLSGRLVTTALVLSASCLIGCSDDGADAAEPAPPPVDPTFTNVRTQVFDGACAFSSCHGDSKEGNLRLGKSGEISAAEVHAALVGAPADIDATMTRVVAGDPSKSFLVAKLHGTFTGLSCDGPPNSQGEHPCGKKMPDTGQALAPAKLDLVVRWIEAGAKND